MTVTVHANHDVWALTPIRRNPRSADHRAPPHPGPTAGLEWPSSWRTVSAELPTVSCGDGALSRAAMSMFQPPGWRV